MLFSPEHSEVKCAKPPFYKDVLLYKITNFSSLPTFSMDFASDGEKFFYLDGSEQSLAQINKASALNLTQETVLPYLNFYFKNISHEDGDIYLIEKLESLPFINSLAPEQKSALERHYRPPHAVYKEESGHFDITSPVFYGGILMLSKIIVDMEGHVHIKEQEMLLKSTIQPHLMEGMTEIE